MSDDWKALFAQALKLIKDVEKNAGPFEWSFGGGTALMLQDGHRESRDIDIFLKNVQLLPYFRPGRTMSRSRYPGITKRTPDT